MKKLTSTEAALMQIGEIAEIAGIGIQALRYYERKGILKPAKKKDSGYRLYNQQSLKTVRFVKNAQDLGFSLKEIKDLLKLRVTSPSRNQSVRKQASAKLDSVREKIMTLRSIEASLEKLINDCKLNKSTGKCPIIDNLETLGDY